ncbi:hypothetical protein NDU88_005865 [Pleurodeles waltl]|uniref:Uncharacterized protein n=1 Tax=Pleurodeles waltl TaxID=8319 RepID=A0AAV7MZM9_PLEWA|nr:hypothetical protein NDU88_005865 [Pleurodeles waltl]
MIHPARGGFSSIISFGAHWPAVLVAAVSCSAVLVAAVSLAAVLVAAVSLAELLVAAVSCSAVLVAAVSLAAVLVAAVSLAAVLVVAVSCSAALVAAESLAAVLVAAVARPLGQVRRWRHPPVYRPLVNLSTMEERHIIVTYRLDRTTILELRAQLEPDLMSAIRHSTGIPPLVQVLAAVCTTNGIPRLKDRCVDSWVVIVWAYSCWRDGVGFVIASLSLSFGVADLCGYLDFGGFRAVGHNGCGGIPRPARCVGSLLHGGKQHLPPML